MTNIPFTDFGGSGETIHFAHANGYPPGCYGELIDLLRSDYTVKAKHFRPLWDSNHEQLKNWKLFSKDLVRFMQEQDLKEIVGLGHSIGAVSSLVAEAMHPGLFKKLVMIEPVILPKNLYLTRRLPVWLAKKTIPIAKIALKRRDRWESKEVLFKSFRKKKVFRNISDDGLKLYAKFATVPHKDGGITLAYSKLWEAQVYCTPIYPWKYIKKVNIPILIIRGQYSDVLTDKTWSHLQSTMTNATFVDIKNVGHLAPIEAPAEVHRIIQDWL